MTESAHFTAGSVEPVEWGDLVPLILHPMKVAILEALRWIDEPLSAADISSMHEDPPEIPSVTHHLRHLAFGMPVLTLYDEERVRGCWKRKLYFFRGRSPASERGC